jgi:hypothetical protein
MRATKIIAGIGLVSAAALLIYTVRRVQKINRMRDNASKRVAEQGYETAHDILFPIKSKRRRIIQYI